MIDYKIDSAPSNRHQQRPKRFQPEKIKGKASFDNQSDAFLFLIFRRFFRQTSRRDKYADGTDFVSQTPFAER